jgi:hypothetical protein
MLFEIHANTTLACDKFSRQKTGIFAALPCFPQENGESLARALPFVSGVDLDSKRRHQRFVHSLFFKGV